MAVIASIEVGGAELAEEDVVGKEETREEERMLGWRNVCARVVCAVWGKQRRIDTALKQIVLQPDWICPGP